MADIRRIVDLYDLYKSYRRVARELKISRNTVKKYVLRVKDVQCGLTDKILPKNREIIQPSRVLSEPVRQKIRDHLESNLNRPKKQRITAKSIWELLVEDGHIIGYSSVKNEVARWKRTKLEEATDWLKMRLAEINAHPVYRRSNVPIRGLDQERVLMHPLPTLEYENYELKRATISRYSLVKHDGNYYSIPDTYRPRYITLKILVDQIDFLDGNAVIASHRRITGKQKYSLDITHYIKTFHRKPGAPANSKVLAQSDELIQNMFNYYYRDDPKKFLPILDLMRETSPDAFSSTLAILNKQNIHPTCDSIRFFLHQTEVPMVEPFAFKGDFEVSEPDFAVVDHFIEG